MSKTNRQEYQVNQRIATLIAWVCVLVLATPTVAHDYSSDSLAKSHPVSVVEADIYVNRFKTTMRLTCFAEDLELLQGVEPLEVGKYDSAELIDATKDHAEYLAEKITIRDATGELLKPRIVEIIDIEIPDTGITSGNLMNFTMGFVMEFSYDQPPEFITIQQDMIADGALLPSEFKILMKQAGSDTPYTHMMKPSQPETFRFDWDNPILSNDSSDEEWEDWFDKQREETLGITSYSSVYSFIYITDFEVRHEVLIPLATLATLLEIERGDPSFLEIDEQAAAARKIEQYFSIGNPVSIDGIEVRPVFDRIDFYGLDLRDFAMQAEKRKVSMASGRVGIIMSYSTKGSPTSVHVSWDRFNDVILSVDAVVFAHQEIEKTRFSRFLEDNTFRWNAPDRPPLPPITGIELSLDPGRYAAPGLVVPVVSSFLIILGLLCLGGLLTGGMTGKLPAIAGIVFMLSSVLTWNIGAVEVSNPFVEQEKFLIDDKNASQVFSQLHRNMFRAFDYHDENDVYDALAISVDGELLRQLYLDIIAGLRISEQGGAVANVKEVDILAGKQIELTPDADDTSQGFGYRSQWKIRGTIEHWGHLHERENVYEAEFQIRLRDDAWKITSMKVVDEKQGVVKTSLRKYWKSDEKKTDPDEKPGTKTDIDPKKPATVDDKPTAAPESGFVN